MTTDIDAKLIEQGRKLFAGDWQFFWASPSIETLPPMAGMEVAFAGRSNVGTSSLINALTGRNALARTVHTRGRADQTSRRLSESFGDVLAHRRGDAGIARRHGASAGGAQLMMVSRSLRILVILAGVMGADGVILAAASAHQPDATRLASASSMLLFHATAVPPGVALTE